MGTQQLIDGMAELYNDVTAAGMYIWAENMAARFEVAREEMDRWSLISHQRAIAAHQAGKFANEIVPYEIVERKSVRVMDQDENPRSDTTIEKLSRLRSPFSYDGPITAGNSSPLNDGACATFVASDDKVAYLGLTPLTRIVSWAIVGVDPDITGYAPVIAIPAALEKAKVNGKGLSLQDIGLFEVNEAFAVMMVTTIRDLNLDPEKVNVNGGAIALGHPVGCSGNRLLLTLSHEMKRRNVEFGVASLCAGGGMGIAVVLQNVN
jgi:acetyl-CoA C-acetyltransferase